MHGREFARAIASATVSLGANALPDQAGDEASASNRMWKILGCGGYYLGPWVPGIDRFAIGGVHCAWYRSNDEAVAQVRAAMGDPAGCRRIADAGRAHALAHHTYAARLRLLLAGREYDHAEAR